VPTPTGISATPSQRVELSRIDANSIATDIESPDIERLITLIAGEAGRLSVKERRLRAVWLLRALARDWDKFAASAKADSRKVGRIHVHRRGTISARWLSRLREVEWVPVGRSGFRAPANAVLKNASTEAIYGVADFVQGIEAEEIPDAMAEALGFVRQVRASDLVEMLEQMRSGTIEFDRGKVRLAYRHLNHLAPRQGWGPVGDLGTYALRARFAGGGGLIVVEAEDGTSYWRQPGQVLRGHRVLPVSSRYVPDGDAYIKLWRLLEVKETAIADCADFLKVHAERFGTAERKGELIEIYGYLEAQLAGADTRKVERLRHVPLACGSEWRARRPVYLVEREDLRKGLRDAEPTHFFWDPPCEPATIPRLVQALGVQLLEPDVKVMPTSRAAELGEELAPRYSEAVAHLSDQLARSAPAQREMLLVSWDQLRTLKLFVYDDAVPVVVSHAVLPRPTTLMLHAHVSRKPLELHIALDSLGVRSEGGRAIASFFEKPSSWAFDGEWVWAWNEAAGRKAEDLRFRVDEEERRRQTEAEAARISVSSKGKVQLPQRGSSATSSAAPVPLPPRKLKKALAGIGDVAVVLGKPPKPAGKQRKTPLNSAPAGSWGSTSEPLANVAYSTQELEDFGWALVRHVLCEADGPELIDFRKRHHVGADGAFDWTRFVELKAHARSMPTSVQMTITEYARALEKGRDYILAITSGAEEGFETRVKLIFDPARAATVAQSESVRLSGLGQASGVDIAIQDEK
jgi:hypothetical protein